MGQGLGLGLDQDRNVYCRPVSLWVSDGVNSPLIGRPCLRHWTLRVCTPPPQDTVHWKTHRQDRKIRCLSRIETEQHPDWLWWASCTYLQPRRGVPPLSHGSTTPVWARLEKLGRWGLWAGAIITSLLKVCLGLAEVPAPPWRVLCVASLGVFLPTLQLSSLYSCSTGGRTLH